MDDKEILENNSKELVLAYKKQCEKDWKGSWEHLKESWRVLEKYIGVVDNQPQIQQILNQRRELLPNILLHSIEEGGNNIVVTSKSAGRIKKRITKKKNFWSEEETKRLKEALRKFGRKNLKQISEFIGSRSISQIRSKLQKMDKKLEKTKLAKRKK